MWSALLLTLAAVPGIDVEARSLSGVEVKGALVGLSAETLTLKTAEGEKALAVRELQSVSQANSGAASYEKAKLLVQLLDGSELAAVKYTALQNKAAVILVGGVEVEIPTRSIHSVRLTPSDAALSKQWAEIAEAKAGGDTLVIRKVSTVKIEGDEKGGEKTQVALDSLEGVLRDVTPDVVQFTYDGDTLDVRREKIEGFLYYHAVERELPAAACRVTDSGGSRWQVRSAVAAGETLELVTVTGVKASLPLARFAKLDYSAGNTVFLGELKPDTVEFRHPLDDRFTTSRLSKFYQPREDRGLEVDSPLRLDGVSHDRGLALQSRTLLVYRLPAKAHWFEALVGLDDAVSDTSEVRLVITGDNKPLFSETILGADQAKAIKLDVSGVRRISILVDAVNDRTSSQLNLVQARITK